MDTATATVPTPARLHKRRAYSIEDSTGYLVADVYGVTDDVRAATAAELARRYNAHRQMVEALKAVYSQDHNRPYPSAIISQVAAALAAAGEEAK